MRSASAMLKTATKSISQNCDRSNLSGPAIQTPVLFILLKKTGVSATLTPL